MLHSQLRLQQLKKKKKMFRSHVDHFEWSNEFYKIFLRIIRVILLQSFLTCFFQFILLRLQNWNIPLLTLSTKENFVESFFKSIIFFFFVIICYIFICYILGIRFKERLLRTVSLRRNDWRTRTDTYPTFLPILVTLFDTSRANIRWWRPKQHDLKGEILRLKKLLFPKIILKRVLKLRKQNYLINHSLND